ncbi:efflux RND transporter permease subunit [Leptospira bouyouniensis]|uniref:Efflux RND transporter permease subunit n=1 Tax=Leptospira bouyouniensis TaxID=2484911 RepID=A0ABY2L2F4_9LEPT|nr:efflux RND transporter permease subunit [Leptospira bouyouniensis]TGK45447.1 efflux RND transporter permease subunit [Leptospira bouyouniensis]
MIRKFITALLNKPIAVFMFAGMVLIFGIISYNQIQFALLPNIEYPRLTILTKFENSSAAEVENLVTKYLTDTLNTVPRIEQIESDSFQGLSIVRIRFKYGTDLAISTLDVREKLDQIRDLLPREASRPLITRFNPGESPFMQIAFTFKNTEDERKLRPFLEENVIFYFERVEGIASVQVSGGYKKEVLIEVDPEKMNFYKTSLDEIKYKIISQNKNIPAGQLPYGNKELLIKTKSQFESLEDIRNLIIGSTQKFERFYLSDISEIKEVYKKKQSYVRYNGKDAVIISLYKESSRNSFSLSKEVKQIFKEQNDLFGNLLNYEIIFNESDYIEESINSLILSLAIGAFLAYLSLMIILKNTISPTLLVTTIPLSIIASILLFRLSGISLNLMSMGGLAIGIGMLFDSSNVVLSGIERNLQLGKSLIDSVIEGVVEVFGSVSSATLTTVIVFLPLVFLESLVGILFSEMAFSIIIIILVSYLISFSFLPVSTLILYKFRNDLNENKYLLYRIFDEEILKQKYTRFLKTLLVEPTKILIPLALILSLSLFVIKFLELDFLPKINTGRYVLRAEFPKGTPLQVMNEKSVQLEKIFREKIDKNYFTIVSRDEIEILKNPNLQKEKYMIQVEFSLERKEVPLILEILTNLRNNPELSNLKFWMEEKGDLLSQLVIFRKDVINLEITGDSPLTISEVGFNLKKKLESNPNVIFVKLGMDTQEPELMLESDNSKLASFGLLNQNIADLIKIGLRGEDISKYKVNANETDIRIHLKDTNIKEASSLLDLRLLTRNGENIALGNLVSYRESNSYPSIQRVGSNIINNVYIRLRDGDSSTRNEILEKIKSEMNRKDISVLPSDEIRQIESAMIELILTLLLSTIIVYMILSGIFETFAVSFIMLLSAPFVLVGTIPFILISGSSLNVSSFIGMILLIGVLVDNASLFYEYFTIYNKTNISITDSILLASQEIFRPVLMNNSTTVFGMLPIAFGLGFGTEFQFPLSIVVISGLIISTFASLYLVPLFFSIYFRKKSLKGFH